ncbi:hypothetical protein Q8A73_012805 [Channa argus]|nr:hypothetical protein Q8A73_012805 [Channa argus]
MTKDTYKHMSREMMMWILVLISLISSVCEMFVIKETQKSYQTEENVTFLWDTKSKTDLSLTNLKCFFQSEPRKVLYEMINGVEYAENQHEQFAGRVQLDRDALREGRIRLHLSTVTAEDSGNYRCDLAFNYDENTRRWTFLDTEKFVLNMSRTTNGGNTDVSLNTPRSAPEIAEDSELQRGKQSKEYVFLALLILMQLATVVAALVKIFCHDLSNKDNDRNEVQSLVVDEHGHYKHDHYKEEP